MDRMMSTDSQNLVEVEIGAMKAYLESIGFESIAQVGHSLPLRHLESGVFVSLTKSADSKLVRPADFLSIKFRLETEGLVSEEAIAELNQGRLPISR